MPQFSALTMAALSVGALAAVGGGVSYAAKDAQPGDFLYPVHASIYGDASVDANADVDLKAIDDLDDEAASLDGSGSVNADVKADIAARYQEHINNLKDRIADFEADGNVNAAAGLRNALRVHLRNLDSKIDKWMSNSSASSMSSAMSSMEASSTSTTNNQASSASSQIHTSVNGDAGINAHIDDDDVDVSGSARTNVDVD